jgi:hypothetical protein
MSHSSIILKFIDDIKKKKKFLNLYKSITNILFDFGKTNNIVSH